jgi:hypothetical protein
MRETVNIASSSEMIHIPDHEGSVPWNSEIKTFFVILTAERQGDQIRRGGLDGHPPRRQHQEQQRQQPGSIRVGQPYPPNSSPRSVVIAAPCSLYEKELLGNIHRHGHCPQRCVCVWVEALRQCRTGM